MAGRRIFGAVVAMVVLVTAPVAPAQASGSPRFGTPVASIQLVSSAQSMVLPTFRWASYGVTAATLRYSYRAGCPVSPASLRMVHVYFVGFDGKQHLGQLVVALTRVPAVVGVFKKLYNARFRIQRMHAIDYYHGSDAASMAANNTSAFNCRAVTGGSSWSQHSYGNAIDINPVQNPYVSGSSVQPAAGRSYLNRSVVRTGMIRGGDVVDRAFTAIGWSWGGRWSSPKDYQHFSANGR
jgi:hypothetical protein